MAEACLSEDNNSSLTAGSEVTFDIVCTPCEYDGDIKEASRYCLECKEHLCTTCLKYHNKLAGSRHHTLVDKDNAQSLLVSDVCTQPCQTHKDEVVKYYCPTHKALGCGECMIRSHDACVGKLCIPDEAKTLKDSKEFKEFQALIEKLTKSSDNIIKSSQDTLKYSADCRVKTLQEIETFRLEINDLLDNLKSELEQQIEEMVTQDKAAMNSVIDKTKTIQGTLQQMASDIDLLLSKGHNCQIFIKMKSNENKLADLQRELEEVQTSGVTAFKFNPNEELQKLMTMEDGFGQLLVMNPKEMRAENVADINVKSSENKTVCWINSAALLTIGKLVVTDWNNETVKLVDTDLKRVTSEYKPEKKAHDVTRLNSNRVAVTLPSAKKIVFMSMDEMITLDGEISVNQGCWNIACISGKLVVSVKDPYEVRILSMTGETLKSFSTSSAGEPLFSSTPRVTVSAVTHTICASGWRENRVIMLDMDGKVIAQYEDDDMRNPACAAQDNMGMLYVCCLKSNNIHLMAPYCSKAKILLTEKEGIKSPYSVCYCEDTRQIYIGMWKNDMIKVYQLS